MKFTTRQREILEVSLSIISKEGVQNFTMRQIAQEIGISEPAIYRHFPNKVAILEALLSQFGSQHKELAQEHLSGDDSRGIIRFLSAILKNLSEKPALSAIVFSEEIFLSEPVLSRKMANIMTATEQAMVTHLEQFSLPAAVSAKHITWMYLGAVRFLVARWRLTGFSFDLVSEGESFINEVSTLSTYASTLQRKEDV